MAREKLSGVALAAIIGKSQPYISRRLSGVLAFDVDDLEVISLILGVSPSELLSEAVRRLDAQTAAADQGGATAPVTRRYQTDIAPVLPLFAQVRMADRSRLGRSGESGVAA